jgi:tRNA-dihydrouridine synthase
MTIYNSHVTTNFWTKLPKPFTAMAPMDDVTDNVFRQVVLSVARPDVFFTEFANVDGLVHGANGIPLRKLDFTPKQHPIVAQIWGTDPINFEKAAKMVAKLGFDGIDINMGCPIREVVKHGAGSGLIGNYELVEKIIKAVKRGSHGLPVSVKTRLGNKINISEEWITFLLKQNLSALTLHARIAKQMSTGVADWNELTKAVEIKNKISPKTLIIGNGDVASYVEVLEKRKEHGVDGVMIGRGVFANPWVFAKNQLNHTKDDYINLLKKHIELFESTWGDTKNFAIIKKFFKMYIKDFRGANQLRIKLMDTKNFDEVRNLITKQ